MAKGTIYIVYVLPVVLSFIFGTFVISDILQDPGRELNLFQVGSIEDISYKEPFELIGLKNQYSNSEPVQIQVIINDISFSCGDLYVSIYTEGKENVITQSGYFEQCFDTNTANLPLNEKFSEIVDKPGKYELVVELLDKSQKNSITRSEEFIVK